MIRTTRRDRSRGTQGTDDGMAQDCPRLILRMGVPMGWQRNHGVGSCTIYPKYTPNSISFQPPSLPSAASMHSSQGTRNTVGGCNVGLTGQSTQKKYKQVECRKRGISRTKSTTAAPPGPRLRVLPPFARCPPKLRPRTQSRRSHLQRETRPSFTNARRRCSGLGCIWRHHHHPSTTEPGRRESNPTIARRYRRSHLIPKRSNTLTSAKPPSHKTQKPKQEG